jgi:hypothetical protein
MALLNIGNIASQPISEGDAGIVLKKDGSFQIFNTHAAVDPSNMTERQIEQTETLMAFAVALQIPEIMTILKQMSHDPNVVGDKILNYGSQH